MIEKMSKKIVDKHTKLSEVVKYHQRLYHTLDAPEISDEAYDSLLRSLLELEEKYPELKSKGDVSERIGATAFATSHELAPSQSAASRPSRPMPSSCNACGRSA